MWSSDFFLFNKTIGKMVSGLYPSKSKISKQIIINAILCFLIIIRKEDYTIHRYFAPNENKQPGRIGSKNIRLDT